MNKIYNFISTIFFISISLFNILIFKFRSSNKATYFIYLKNSAKIDNRSIPYLEYVNLNQTLNLVRTNSDILNLKLILKLPNVVFFSKIELLILILKKLKLIKNYNYSLESLIGFIFSFSGINKFLSIDDYRIIKLFDKICNKKKIFSIIYMHGRFSSNQIPLKKIKPNLYIVWSDFFKKKLISLNSKINPDNIFVCGNPNLHNINLSKSKIKEQKNILFIYEDNMRIRSYLEIADILKDKGIKFYFKTKPGYNLLNETQEILKKKKINILTNLTLSEIVKKFNIAFLIAFDSTMMIESIFYEIIPIKLKSNSRFSDELVNQNLIYKLDNNKKIYSIIKKKKTIKKKIIKNKKYVWGFKTNKNIRKSLIKQNF